MNKSTDLLKGLARCVLALLIALIAGCATSSQPSKQVVRMENRLTQCGFKMVTATTPDQEQHLQSLPPGKLSVLLRNGHRYYVFPDAARNTLYVGRTTQYLAYQRLLSDMEEEEQYDQMSRMDPSIAQYNNEAEILEGNDTSVDWSWEDH